MILSQKQTGNYLCDSLYVQFGDAFVADLPYFSGAYMMDPNGGMNAGRITYVEKATRGSQRFAFCEREMAWTLSNYRNEDPCVFYAKSPKTQTFDVTTLLPSSWFVRDDETGQFVPFDAFALVCNDCNAQRCSEEYGRLRRRRHASASEADTD